MEPQRLSLDQILAAVETSARTSVRTQYACQVVRVSEDGRFVDLVHNTLEYAACPDGDVIMRNSYGQDVVCSPTKPWTLTDVPVEQPYIRGQWNIRVRPRVGDRGILSVFYHDISSLKEKGGFQAPSAIRVMAIDSASWRPGLPNHAEVNAETEPYPSDDEFEIAGNGVSVKLTAPNNDEAASPHKLDVAIGGVELHIIVPESGAPTIDFNAPQGAITVNADTANVNLATSATVTTPQTTINGNVSINGDINISGAVDVGTTVTAGTEVTAAGINLTTHTHLVTGAAALVPPPAPTPPTGTPIAG